MNKEEYKTDFLLPKSSFWSGMGSVLNIAGGNTSEFSTSSTGEEADLKAIRSDWGVVGQDFKKVIDKILQ